MQHPTVHVVDDEHGMRHALGRLLRQADYQVEVYPGAQRFLAEYNGDPGYLLLDLAMPEMRGEELLEEIARRGYPLAVLVLTGHATIPAAMRVTRAGALDLLEKPFSGNELLQKLDGVVRQARKLFARHYLIQDYQARLDLLTKRENDVFGLIVAGLTSQEIAEQLGLSRKTIDIHRGRVMTKMSASTLPELVMNWATLGRDQRL